MSLRVFEVLIEVQFVFVAVRMGLGIKICPNRQNLTELGVCVLASENLKMMDPILYGQRISRTFVFEREETQQSTIIETEIDMRPAFINLNPLLHTHCPQATNRVSIYDPSLNRFTPIKRVGGDHGFLPRIFLEPRVILVRFRRGQDYGSESDSVDSGLEEGAMGNRQDGRSKERTIGQVLELVKRWRHLHLHGHRSLNRRMNLQDAARVVGVSKKSLDDYYCQLRLGEFYNFNFEDRLHERIGVLRSFVKEYRPENDRGKHQKHPKQLRVIEQYDPQTKSLRPLPKEELSYSQQEPRRNEPTEQQEDDILQHTPANEPLSMELFNLEHEFFRGFELVMDEPSDPYFEVERDFRKKEYMDEGENDSVFFF